MTSIGAVDAALHAAVFQAFEDLARHVDLDRVARLRPSRKVVARPRNVPKELEERGILVRAASRATVDEEIPEAYKDVAKVVEVVHAAGIGRKVAKLIPVGVVKG